MACQFVNLQAKHYIPGFEGNKKTVETDTEPHRQRNLASFYRVLKTWIFAWVGHQISTTETSFYVVQPILPKYITQEVKTWNQLEMFPVLGWACFPWRFCKPTANITSKMYQIKQWYHSMKISLDIVDYLGKSIL